MKVRVKIFGMPLDLLVSRATTGQQLLNSVAGELSLRDPLFFGLQFVDYKGTSTWLGSSETLSSQRIRKEYPLHFQLLVRFWPRDVWAHVSDETTLMLLCRQQQAAVDSGESFCPFSTAAQLAAYAVQIRYGDYAEHQQSRYADTTPPLIRDSSGDGRSWLPPEAQSAWRLKVACLHRNVRGLTKRDALVEYFKLAQELPTYGVTFFDVVTKTGADVWLGVAAGGVQVYEDKLTPKLSFLWSDIHSICGDGQKLVIKRESRQADFMSDRDSKFVYYTSRKQVCMSIVLLIRGYNELEDRLRLRARLMQTSPTDQGRQTGRLSLNGAERTASSSPTPAGETASTSASSRLAPAEDVEERSLPMRGHDATVVEDHTDNAEGHGDTPVAGDGDGVAARGSSEVASSSGSDRSSGQSRTSGAEARRSSGTDEWLALSETLSESEAEASGAESSMDGIHFRVSGDAACGCEISATGERGRGRYREPGLSMSASECWGPFSMSLMAPD